MTVIALPSRGQWAWDSRGEGRAVRVSAHAEAGLLNVSMWRDGTCVGTAHLLPADAGRLMTGLASGLATLATERPAEDAASADAERLRALESRLAELETRLRTPAWRRAVPGVGAVADRIRDAVAPRR